MANIQNVTPNIIEAYQQELMRSASPATAKRKEASLNKFFNWAEANGHIEKNPMPARQLTSSAVIPDMTVNVRANAKSIPFKTWGILGVTVGLIVLTFAAVSRLNVPISFITNQAMGLNVSDKVSVNSPTPTTSPIPIPGLNTDTAVNKTRQPRTEAITSLVLSGNTPKISAPEGSLLIQGQGVTLKANDGSNGNIIINPDGTGNAQFIFEGSGANQLDIENPNLSSGSLIYGKVANNAIGYYLLKLDSSAVPTAKFSVDGIGNTYINGDINTPGNIQINGVTRLSSLGRLGSITGYYQDSGLFQVNQGAVDYATITKTLSNSTGVSTADQLTLTLDESSLSNGSNYNTLVLKRLGGASNANALVVDSGSSLFKGNVTANSDVNLGDDTTDKINFVGRVAQNSSLIPITTVGINDLGSSSLPWDDVYAGIYTTASGSNLTLRASGSGIGQTGTGSIYFQDSNGKIKGRLDTTQTGLYVGDGKDGAVSYSTATTINDNSQSYFGIQPVTTTSNSGQNIVSTTTTTNLAVGDEVLLIQMQGNGAGGYEFHKITSVSPNTSITLDDVLTNSYTKDSTSSAQIVEVPHFTSVTFSGTGSISPKAWDGTTGGILIFRASGAVDCTNAAAGCVFADGKGFRGGASSEAGSAFQGEGIGLTQSNSVIKRWDAGGGGTRGSLGGGGSGGGEYSSGSNAPGGTGGRAILPLDLSKWFLGGGGGGGGDDSDIVGIDGGPGASGGGIVYIEAQKIVIPSGKTVTSLGGTGGAGVSNDGGGGGGGGGGFVWLRGDTIDLLDQTTTRYVIASGGAGGALHGSGAAGVVGGDGIARIEARQITGSANESSTVDGLNIGYGTNSVSTYGILHIGKVDTDAADVAEIYQSEQALVPGDIVETSGSVNDPLIDPRLAIQKTGLNSESILGAVSTKPGVILGNQDVPNKYRVFPIALSGRTPIKVSNINGNIFKGDAITASMLPGYGEKALASSNIVGYALEGFDPAKSPTVPCPLQNNDGSQVECGSIYVFIKPGWYNSPLRIAGPNVTEITSNLANLVASGAGDFAVGANEITDLTVKNVLAATNFIAGYIRAGTIEANTITAQIFKTKLISPLADESNIYVQLGSNSTPSGKLAIQNYEGQEVASIDSSGNATFSGIVKSDLTDTNTLVAGTIKSKSIDEITAALAQVETNQNLIKQAQNWNTNSATNTAQFNALTAEKIYVTGQAGINSLYINSMVSVGSDLIASSVTSGNTIINSIDTLNSPLRLQSLAVAPIELMGGAVIIDTKGNISTLGNLNVTGQIQGSSLTLGNTGDTGNILSIKDKAGTTLAAVDASGSARFNSVSVENFVVADPLNSTASAIINGIITTNSVVGSAKIPGGVSEITIKNPKVTDYSLVYVTPTSDTQNNVLYVKSKQNGEFVVGFTNPINIDANFNWWIVQIGY